MWHYAHSACFTHLLGLFGGSTLIFLWVLCLIPSYVVFTVVVPPLYPLVASDRPYQSMFCGQEITQARKEIKFRDWSNLLKNKALSCWSCDTVNQKHRDVSLQPKSCWGKDCPSYQEILLIASVEHMYLCLSANVSLQLSSYVRQWTAFET